MSTHWSIKDEIDKVLLNFSKQLRPTPEYMEKAKKAVNTVVLRLQEKSRFGIDRPYTGGSMGKKTSVINSDCDEVLMVNIDSIDKIKDVLDDFENILELTPPGKLSDLRRTRFSVQFKFNDFDMDFLPAINFVQNRAQQPGNPTLAAQQAWNTLKKIKAEPNKAYHYSSALVESNLRFMAEQSSDIHNLVIICKFWNKSLLIDEYISGRSSIIELIAVYAGQKEENRSSEGFSLLSGFQTFLRLVENFPQLNIVFGFDPLKGSGYSINQLIGGRGVAGLHVKNGRALIVEPANPFNNIAEGVNERVMKLFQLFAKETLGRLEGYVTMSKFTRLPLDDIFAPQPLMIPCVTENQQRFFKSARFMAGVTVEKGQLAPSMTIRNEDKYGDRDMQDVLKHLQTVHLVVSQGFVSSFSTEANVKPRPAPQSGQGQQFGSFSSNTNGRNGAAGQSNYFSASASGVKPQAAPQFGSFSPNVNVKPPTAEDVRRDLGSRIERSIKTHIPGVKTEGWGPSSERHEDKEVTLTIPCQGTISGVRTDFVVRVSFSSA